MDLKKLQTSNNIAELLDEQELLEIAYKVDKGFDYDKKSREDWEKSAEDAMKIAKQVVEVKDLPWEGCANVKYPLITQASVDFAAREYPELIKNDKVVKAAVIGSDPQEEKFRRCQRVGKFMSFQLLNLMDNWEAGVDKLLHMLPVLGTVFKKTYYNDLTEEVCSDLCHPERIVVNYNIKSLETAPRITHILTMTKNDLYSRISAGLYLDIDYANFYSGEVTKDECLRDEEEFLEQHCWLDLDKDGYEEPYIVVQHRRTKTVFRIISRFKSIQYNKKKLIQIKAKDYFTAFHFIMSPDGGFYGVGLGTLLLPLNKSINSLLNQLIDAGTLNNTQAGLYDSKLRLQPKDLSFKGGEFKAVQVSGMNKLSDYVYPLPTKEPSTTLFQLLGLLITASKDLVSNTDLLKGKGETQNVPATTTMAMIDQGLKIYNAITKRLFLAQAREYQKIFEINQEYLSNMQYLEVLDDPEADVSLDFNLDKMDITTVGDSAAATETQRMARAQVLLSIPGFDQYEIRRDMLEGMGFDEDKINRLLPKPDPNAPPAPEVQELMAKIEKYKAEVAKLMAEAQDVATKTQIAPVQLQLDISKGAQDAKESESRIMESQGRAGKMQHDAAINEAKLHVESTRIQVESQDKQGLAILDHTAKMQVQEMKAHVVAAQVSLKQQELIRDSQKANE